MAQQVMKQMETMKYNLVGHSLFTSSYKKIGHKQPNKYTTPFGFNNVKNCTKIDGKRACIWENTTTQTIHDS
jgi:hypothetical protein